MIKYNNLNINGMYFDESDIIKVYRNNAVCYYKIVTSGSTPTFDVCYAVVDDILQYQETEFEDVYDKATEKWYKLNNLNEYEEYGVYGSGRSVTTYNGKLTIDDGYEYEWNGSSWVNVGEVSGSTAALPDVPFVLNYNARQYNASTHTIPYTEGALNEINAVITGETANIIDHSSDGYIQLTGSNTTTIRALVGTTNFSRSASNPNITIICKAYTPGSSTEGNILSNRNESYNWMYRHKSSILTFHGNSEQGSIAVSNTEPNTCSVRINSSRLLTYNNWTQNTTSTYSNFSYGSNSYGGALFAGYYSSSGEMWKGVFYWIYMSLNTLTDEQVQQVIDYNENSTTSEYPKYYSEKSDPLDNLTFSSMTEATEYAYNNCVYNGMKATIAGTIYIFSGDSQSGYEWVENPSRLPSGYTEVEYIENQNMACIDTGFKPNQDTRIVCEMQAVSNSVWGKFFGAGGYDKVGAVQLDYETNPTGTLHLTWGTATGWTIISSVSGDFNKHAYDWNKNEVYRDNTLVHTFTYSNFQSTYNLCIFVNSTGNGTYETNKQHFLIGKLYTFKLYDNGTLVRDLIPCINPNNVVGAYDIVNDVFYSCPRSGYSLVAGPIV